ncbi:MAG: UMP kinase [Candidatus Lloydbacteria bacterium RIFCSPHIGHO2_02_FULL_50_13]|uniref:Uridylate kinase n=1 Tax=Candidatus Lloydbacteria bacterium RIFCSPHIGHO2_02_FULL_50_13 TaxID=1798661 RepID=A0A1G2D2U2_9BACT|nr:MAG: UMP kinase [Candidatus Lloydbacteria bacterium RIFCSPHIGHO2_02_FULL_50_13]
MRLLIKLSGESLSGTEQGGGQYSEPTLRAIALSIGTLQKVGHQVALVVGGGNLFRGHKLTEQLSIERPTADYIGMLATVQNALVLRDYFQTKGIETRVSSAITMPQICEGYIPQRARRHLEKGRVVIFAAGLGAPYFTTDSTSVQRALEVGAEMVVMAKNGVDGLYTGDPKQDTEATLLKSVTASEVLEKNLKVADQSAVALAKEHGLTIKIVGVPDIAHALDEKVGSTILPK